MFCKHGTYIGTPHGADHMCGYCEDGTEPEAEYDLVEADGTMILPGPFTLQVAETLAKAAWAAGTEAYTNKRVPA